MRHLPNNLADLRETPLGGSLAQQALQPFTLSQTIINGMQMLLEREMRVRVREDESSQPDPVRMIRYSHYLMRPWISPRHFAGQFTGALRRTAIGRAELYRSVFVFDGLRY